MGLFEMQTFVVKDGRIILPAESLAASGLKPGDEVCVNIVVSKRETANQRPQIVITPQRAEAAVQQFGWQEYDGDLDLILPNTLLEAAEIPKGSDLEIVCTAGAIIFMEADILDNLPDELVELFDKLGVDPGTVREVMRKEGYFVEGKTHL